MEGEETLPHTINSPITEAFRTLRTNIRYTSGQDKVKTIMVTSFGLADGKSLVAINLARSFSMVGEKVLVLDCDLRKPRVHRELELPNKQGMTTALVEKGDLAPLIQESGFPGLHVLTSGPIPPNPAELLQSDRTDEILKELREIYDHVIVDTPPAGPLADPSILASKMDGIIMVLSAGETRIDQAQDLKEILERAQGRILGVVLNKVKYSSREYKYRYYYYSDNEDQGLKTEDAY